MKLQNIKITGLFGTFNHEIELNNSSRITILIGENGLGKTVLLEMIEAFFTRKYSYFNSIAFDKIIFEFDDGIKWVLSKDNLNAELPDLLLTQINKNNSEYKPIILSSYLPRDLEIMAHRISKDLPFLRRIGGRTWENRKTGETIRTEEIALRFGRYMHSNIHSMPEEAPRWYQDRQDKIKVSLIETQRLISLEDKEEKTHKKAVENYSLALTKVIKSYLTDSTELSSKLDRTYPNRLISRLKKTLNVTDEDLNRELNRLENKRMLLDAVGLIEIERESNILQIANPQEVVRDVLMLYVEDSFKKIEIFDQLASKIEIFLDIINRRFKHKRLYIDKEEGFLLKSTKIFDNNGEAQRIPVSKLSSGEQNELVLFYLLLFKTEANSIILIDEPEVSLHISWQNSFIEDLKQITKLNNLDVLIATHSPDIIANNWDLRVELKGLE